MNNKTYLKLPVIILGMLIISHTPAFAILGSTAQENETVYGVPASTPKYKFGGSKGVVLYKTKNAVVTVIYRDNISILENISYNMAVDTESAMADIKGYILPLDNQTPLFTSTMPFAEAYFEENIYKKGIKTKILYNSDGKATEIMSSIQSTADIAREKIDE